MSKRERFMLGALIVAAALYATASDGAAWSFAAGVIMSTYILYLFAISKGKD
jgi:hypothetical protein